MNRISNSLAVTLLIMAMAGLGLGVFAMRVSGDAGTRAEYNFYIALAREKAGKGMTYYAKMDYLSAFAIYNKDQDLFREFLEFLKDAEDGSYRNYLRTYLSMYPQDVEAYERLCAIYYEESGYKEVQTLLSSAEAAGVSSETLLDYKEKVEYEFIRLGGGYTDCSVFYGEQAVIAQGDKKGLYYFGSGLVLQPVYDDLSFYINGAIAVKKDGECYFTDLYGNKSGVFDRKIDSLSMFSNGYCAVSVDGRYTYADSSLSVGDHFPYEDATPFSDEIAAVKADGKWGIINTDAEYVVQPKYDDIVLTEFGTCISCGVIFVRDGEGYLMLDKEGERMNDYVFQEVCHFGLSGQPAAVKLDNRWTFVKTTGELFETGQEVFAAKSYSAYLAPVTLDGELWGYMDAYGKIVIEPQFRDCLQFSNYGIAPVKEGELWSMIRLIKYT